MSSTCVVLMWGVPSPLSATHLYSPEHQIYRILTHQTGFILIGECEAKIRTLKCPNSSSNISYFSFIS